MAAPVVSHISDTALWVAVLRARESRRPDAIFRDPLAEKLAGARGHEIADNLGNAFGNPWPVIMRTKVIDDLVSTSISEGADRVINMAAGLDSRPYRLPLPPTMTWIEADLPALIDEKERLLAGEKPVCQLSREKVDLADEAARGRFLDRALDGARRALVITEGLLIYLEASEVSAIARDLHERSAVSWWMTDLASPGVLRIMQRRMNPKLSDGAQMKFGPREGVSFFGPLGWKARDIRSLFGEARRHKRLPAMLRLFSFLPEANPEHPGNRPWGAVVRFARA